MLDERTFSKDYPPMHICGVELSNQFLLRVTALSFLLFVVAEIIGALASNSLSLLGDAGAMSVDVFTVIYICFPRHVINFALQYLCNMYSEYVKSKGEVLNVRTKFILEVGVPLFSVCALMGVTIWITLDAIAILRNPDDSDDVNVAFLFGFAGEHPPPLPHRKYTLLSYTL